MVTDPHHPMTDYRYSENTVSTIVRFCAGQSLDFLDRALFSLANQSHPNVQVVVAIQNGYPDLVSKISSLILRQPFFRGAEPEGAEAISEIGQWLGARKKVGNHWIVWVNLPLGMDGRSLLLNIGLGIACGRFIGFLDYDDVLYPHAYEQLVNRIHISGAALAAGGCIIATQRPVPETGAYYTVNKALLVTRPATKADLLLENFLPINTYLVDRRAVHPSYLTFDTNLSANEDYLFLLRIASEYELDLQMLQFPVAEYNQRLDGTNTIQVGRHVPEKEQMLIHSYEYVERIKKALMVRIRASEIAAIVHESRRGPLLARVCREDRTQPGPVPHPDEQLLGSDHLVMAAMRVDKMLPTSRWVRRSLFVTARLCWRFTKRLHSLLLHRQPGTLSR